VNHGEIVSFLWGVADLIRDTFRRGHYQDVILPLTVLRRLDCVLADKKKKVLQRQAELRGKGLQDLNAQLRRTSGFAFYNTSKYDFNKLIGDAPDLAANLRKYIAGFSPNMCEVLPLIKLSPSSLNNVWCYSNLLNRTADVALERERGEAGRQGRYARGSQDDCGVSQYGGWRPAGRSGRRRLDRWYRAGPAGYRR